MSKACQYVTNETKVGVAMKEVNLKDAKVVSKKQLSRQKNLERVNMNGKTLAMRLTCNTKISKPF